MIVIIRKFIAHTYQVNQKKIPPTTFVDITAMHGNFCTKFYTIVKRSNIHFITKFYWNISGIDKDFFLVHLVDPQDRASISPSRGKDTIFAWCCIHHQQCSYSQVDKHAHYVVDIHVPQSAALLYNSMAHSFSDSCQIKKNKQRLVNKQHVSLIYYV